MDAEFYADYGGDACTCHDSEHVPVLKEMKRFLPEETEAMAAVLKRDGCISVPTDTVYGVCARITEAGQEKLYEVKNRPRTKQFPVMCSDLCQAKTIAEVSDCAEKLMHAFMPGPLTVILKKKADAPAAIHGDTVAVRLAVSEPLRKLIEETGMPIFLTSANQSGQKECTSLDEIEEACPLLDGMMEGTVSFGMASTIADCTGDAVRILRNGPITEDMIQNVMEG